MGSVIKQLSDELNQRQREVRYGIAKGALVGTGLMVVAAIVLLWKRPVALLYVVSALGSLALLDSVWVFPLVVSVVLGGLIVFDVFTNDGRRLYEIRRSLTARRIRIGLKRGWKNAMSDLGLTTSYDRRGSSVVMYPKLDKIEERK